MELPPPQALSPAVAEVDEMEDGGNLQHFEQSRYIVLFFRGFTKKNR